MSSLYMMMRTRAQGLVILYQGQALACETRLPLGHSGVMRWGHECRGAMHVGAQCMWGRNALRPYDGRTPPFAYDTHLTPRPARHGQGVPCPYQIPVNLREAACHVRWPLPLDAP
jgi:hypothetical protein